ncbi:MAG: glycoside hydrolase family 28 protein [Streptosporangiaceae bacterium]
MKIRFRWLPVATAVGLAIAAGQALAPIAFAAGPQAAGTSATAMPTATATPTASATTAAAQLPEATGDPRHPRQPFLPGVCIRLRAGLSTSTGEFSTADETTPPDTSRIQRALDLCAYTGRAVELVTAGSNNAFLSGPLTIRAHEVLLVQDGATLYASLNPADYQIPSQAPANTCGTVSAAGGGCYPFITFGGSDSGLMGTRGQDGSLGAIDGRGNGTLVGSTQTWWDVAAAAASDGNQNNPILVQGSGVNNITIFQVELENSPMYHIEISSGFGLTVWGVEIDSPATARNTDGVDPESESDVTIKDDMIQNGDDCVAVKANPGIPSRNITVDDVHCYGSHGLSVGSQTAGGVANVLFENSTLNGFDSFGNLSASDTGIQVKTDANSGGLTQQVTYRDICMTNIKHVLIFNPHYSSGGTSVPTQSDVVLNGVVSTDSESGAYSIFEGYDAQNPLQLELENIDLDNVTQDGNHGNEGPTEGESPTQYVQAYVSNSNIVPAGPLGNSADDVSVTQIQGTGSIPACSIPSFGPPPVLGWGQG